MVSEINIGNTNNEVDNPSNESNVANFENSNDKKIIGYIQAGPVKGAKVYVEGPNGEILYETVTDESGRYEIDKKKLMEKIYEYGYDSKTILKVYTDGGVDIDVNDDGVSGDMKDVKESLVGLLNISELNDSRITPISTLISKYLLDVLQINLDEITSEELDKIAKKLGFTSYIGVLKYDMIKDDSDVEKRLRETGFIEFLHSGYFEDGKDEKQVVKQLINDSYETVISEDDIKDVIPEDYKDEIEKIKDNSEMQEDEIIEKIEEIEEKIKELENQSGNKEKIEKEIEELKKKLEEYKNELDNVRNKLNEKYRSLNNVEKVLIDPSKSRREKKETLDKDIGNIKVRSIDFMNRSVEKAPIVTSDVIEEGKGVIDEKRQELIEEVKRWEKIKEEKYKIYLSKKKEYEEGKKNYEESKREYETARNKYLKLQDQYNSLVRELDYVESKLSELNKKVDIYNGMTLNSDKYPISSKKYPEYAGKTYSLKKLDFVYRGHKVLGTITFPEDGGFPVEFNLYVDGKKINKKPIKFNSTKHIDDYDDIIADVVKLALDIKYYRNQKQQLQIQIEGVKQQMDEALAEMMIYSIFADVDEDYYKKEEEEYEKAKREYEEAEKQYQLAKEKLDRYERDIEDYGNISVNFIEVKDIYQTYQSELENKLIALSSGNDGIQKEKEKLENQKEQLMEEYSFIYSIKDEEEDIFIKLRIKKEYRGNKDKVIVPYINGLKYGTDLYIRNPFTVYVQYGVGNHKYPAKVWIEFKLDAYENSILMTRIVEAKSDEEVKKKVEELIKEMMIIKNLKLLRKEKVEKLLDDYYKSLKAEVDNLKEYYSFYGDAVGEYYKVDEELKEKIGFYARALVDYEYYFNTGFRKKVNNYVGKKTKERVKELKEKGEKNINEEDIRKEILKGTLDGLKQATKDYIETYVELLKTLIEPRKIIDSLGSIFEKVIHPIDTIEDIYYAIKKIIRDAKELISKMIGLEGYEKAYGISYGGGIMGYMVVDPGGKIMNVIGGRIIKLDEKLMKTYRVIKYMGYKRAMKIYMFLPEKYRNFIKVLYLTDKYDYIKNKIGLLHVLFGEWKWIVVDGKVVRGKLGGGLHSARVVEELLKRGEIKVAVKLEPGKGRKELNYEEFKRLENIENERFKIISSKQEVPDNPKNWPGRDKTLFPKDRTKEKIAEAFAKAEREIIYGFGGKMVKELDEETFKKYLKEGGGREELIRKNKLDEVLEKFRNGEMGNIEFGLFGKRFDRNVIEYNGLEIRVGGRYVYRDGKYILEEQVNTLIPKNE